MDTIIKYGVMLIAIGMSYVQYYFGKRMEEFPEPKSRIEKLYLNALPVFMFFSAIYMIAFVQPGYDIFLTWKRIILLSLLWMLAFTDYKCHLIFNEYLLMGLGFRGLLMIAEILISVETAFAEIVIEVIGAVILVMFGIMLRFLSRKGIGMGDIKLFGLLPFFLGTLDALRAVLYSMIIIFVMACWCLIAHKKGRKDVLPFAPAVFGGVCVVIFILKL